MKKVRLEHCRKCKEQKSFCTCKREGRPPSITPEKEARIEEALRLGMPLNKALDYAEVHTRSYYRKWVNDPKFHSKMRAARYFATMLARQSVIRNMATNGQLALSYLERKEKDEFSLKQTIEHEGSVQLDLSAEAKKRLGKYE